MKSKKAIVSIWVNPGTIAKLDNFRKKAEISRSKLILNLIDIGCDEIKIQKNLGIVKLTLALSKLQGKISKLLFGAKNKIVISETEPRGSNISVRIDPKTIQKIDNLAQQVEMTRSTFIEYILEISIREITLILKVPGIGSTGLFVRDFNDELRKIWKKMFKKSEIALKEEKVISELNEDIEENNQ